MKPTALAVWNTHNDFRNGTDITAIGAQEAFGLITAGSFAKLTTEKNLYGTGTCYAASAIKVKEEGGSVVYGWLVYHNPNGIKSGSNDYAGWEAVAHAVWQRSDAQLMEVTHIPAEVIGFVPHSRVKALCQTSINFIDRFGDAKMIGICEPASLLEVMIE